MPTKNIGNGLLTIALGKYRLMRTANYERPMANNKAQTKPHRNKGTRRAVERGRLGKRTPRGEEEGQNLRPQEEVGPASPRANVSYLHQLNNTSRTLNNSRVANSLAPRPKRGRPLIPKGIRCSNGYGISQLVNNNMAFILRLNTLTSL